MDDRPWSFTARPQLCRSCPGEPRRFLSSMAGCIGGGSHGCLGCRRARVGGSVFKDSSATSAWSRRWRTWRRRRIPRPLFAVARRRKATLARRFATHLLGGAGKMRNDDLTCRTRSQIEEREKCFRQACGGPAVPLNAPRLRERCRRRDRCRQISISRCVAQERAPFKADARASSRVSDRPIDRAGEQAANSLLKTLEEPPIPHPHSTAENIYDCWLHPSAPCRSTSPALSNPEMQAFLSARKITARTPRGARRQAVRASRFTRPRTVRRRRESCCPPRRLRGSRVLRPACPFPTALPLRAR